ncbi:MAG: aminotransferase class V-fold PLP-dependent enzyme, partial [Vibrio sp.]
MDENVLFSEVQRSLFPALQNDKPTSEHPPIFLDGPGGAQVPLSVMQAMQDYLSLGNSNLGGCFQTSQRTQLMLDKARTLMRLFVNASSDTHVVFGANMTSLTFHLSRCLSQNWKSGDEIIVTCLDHDANITPWLIAAKEKQACVHQLSVDPYTQIDLAELEYKLSHKTQLVAVTYASNVTGSIQPIQQITQLAHKYGALVYVDGVHYAPHDLIDLQQLGADVLVCSAYKFYGPHLGIACIAPHLANSLQPDKLRAVTTQGEGRFETGTLNFEAIAGLIACLEYIASLHSQIEFEALRQKVQQADFTERAAEFDSDSLWVQREHFVRAFEQINAYETALFAG